MNRIRAWTHKQLLTAALAAVLLFAQGLGLLHSIAHAGLHAPAAMAMAEAADQADAGGNASSLSGLFDSRHSCTAFDALTLAFAVVATSLAILLFARAAPPAVTPARRRPTLAPPRRFRSRAPPVLIA